MTQNPKAEKGQIDKLYNIKNKKSLHGKRHYK